MLNEVPFCYKKGLFKNWAVSAFEGVRGRNFAFELLEDFGGLSIYSSGALGNNTIGVGALLLCRDVRVLVFCAVAVVVLPQDLEYYGFIYNSNVLCGVGMHAALLYCTLLYSCSVEKKKRVLIQ